MLQESIYYSWCKITYGVDFSPDQMPTILSTKRVRWLTESTVMLAVNSKNSVSMISSSYVKDMTELKKTDLLQVLIWTEAIYCK